MKAEDEERTEDTSDGKDLYDDVGIEREGEQGIIDTNKVSEGRTNPTEALKFHIGCAKGKKKGVKKVRKFKASSSVGKLFCVVDRGKHEEMNERKRKDWMDIDVELMRYARVS